MLTFYIMQDDHVPGAVKVGKDTKWPKRYKQARCHTPGHLSVSAIFQLPDHDRAGQERLDDLVYSVLPEPRDVSYKSSRVDEWFDLEPESAFELISKLPEFSSAKVKRDVVPSLLSTRQKQYEDWRDRGCPEFRWRAFLYQVADMAAPTGHPHVGRLKIAAGSLYDTAYRYNFTYCPFPVLLVGGFETALPIAENNQRIMAGWGHVVETLGNGPNVQPMGWLNAGLSPSNVQEALVAYDCTPFPLLRGKPADARTKDPSVTAITIGATHSSDRIVDFFH